MVVSAPPGKALTASVLALAAGLATGLVATSTALLAPVPAAAQQPRVRLGAELPGLVSAPAPPRRPQVPAQGSFGDRIAPLAGFDPDRSVEVAGLTTATQRVLRNVGGSTTLELASRPVRFQDVPGGAWRAVELDLVRGPGGELGPRAAPGGRRLGPADAEVATVGTSAGVLALRHPGAGAVQPMVSGRRATYPGALSGGRDLVLDGVSEGFEESVVLHDAMLAGGSAAPGRGPIPALLRSVGPRPHARP